MKIIVENVNSHVDGEVYNFLWEPRNELLRLPKSQYRNHLLQSKLGLIVSPETPSIFKSIYYGGETVKGRCVFCFFLFV